MRLEQEKDLFLCDRNCGANLATGQVCERNRKRTTSFLEQFIEDVVSVIIPNLLERLLGEFQPSRALQIRIDGHAHMRVLGQWQRLLKNQFAVLVYSVNGCDHGGKNTTAKIISPAVVF